MHYDIASKRLMEIGGAAILSEVAGVNVRTIDPLDELPQEQASITRNDFSAKCTLANGKEAIVLLEFQTEWKQEKLLDMLIYAAQRLRRHRLPVVQVMLLFQPCETATGRYSEGGITFEFSLVRIWELPVETFLNPAQPGLWPLAALAKGGLASAEKVDKLLHHSPLPPRERSDLLTIFAIFLGMRDKSIAAHFIQNRRELMIESPVYDLIRNEGRDEGYLKGLREQLEEMLTTFFDQSLSLALKEKLNSLSTAAELKAAQRKAVKCASLAEFEQVLESR